MTLQTTAHATGLSSPSPQSHGDAAAPPDRIFLRDHVVEAEIGAFQAERGITQRVRFSMIADLLPAPRDSCAGPRASDDVDTILSYDLLLDAIHDEMAGRRINLLETLAEGIAARVLAHAGIAQIQIVIEKLDRVSGTLGIDITRRRPKAVVLAAPDLHPLPDAARIVVIGRDALDAPDLTDRLAALAEAGPMVLCVDAPGAPEDGLPVAVQRRVDLLAFGQAAWHLAARGPDFVVVDSRTELDWGLRNGQVSVWAPSKMVVDARQDTPRAPLRMGALAAWLARRMGIARIETLGEVTLPDTAGLTLTRHGA